jgi:hypothetical protein
MWRVYQKVSKKDKEGELILAKVNADQLILLDETEKLLALDSQKNYKKEMNSGIDTCFNWGPYGFWYGLFKAQGKISLSLMTFSSNGALILLSNCIEAYDFEKWALSSPVIQSFKVYIVSSLIMNSSRLIKFFL